MSSPVLTPDGHKYDPHNPLVITDSWLQPTDYPNLVKYSNDPDKTAFLNRYILDACAAVNMMCNRFFNQQQIDQIFKDKVLNIREYSNLVLNNYPLVSIDNVWVEVVNSFAPIDLQFIQVLTREGILKVLPSFSVYAQTTLPMYALATSTSVWVRYTSGYLTASSNSAEIIPNDVKRATALYVDYLFGLDDIVPNVSSFKTQTYSQNSATFSEDPLLTRIHNLLEPYKLGFVQ